MEKPLGVQPDPIGRFAPTAVNLTMPYYNFVRPHRALRFGREVRTPAIQAGLTTRRLTFREGFSSTIILLVWQKVTSVFVRSAGWVIGDDRQMQLAT